MSPDFLPRMRAEWLGNIRADLLSGLVVALALIPEAIAFSIIAGVDPKIGLYASFSIAVITAIAGGRPGMISAATAATAVLMVTLVRDHGLEYLLAATLTNFNARTLTPGLSEYVTPTGTKWGIMAAISVFTLIPALIVFGLVQRHIVAGLTFGAVKG